MRNPMIRSVHPQVPRRVPVPPDVPKPDLFLSVDLGQLTDYSATALVRRTTLTEEILNERGNTVIVPRRSPLGHPIRQLDVVGLRRYDLGTSYVNIVRHVKEQLDRFPGATLILDASGTGRAITDMFRELWVIVNAITITGGQSWSNPAPFEYHVSKVDLVAAIRADLERELLKIAIGVSHADILKREMLDFKIKVSKAQNEIYSAREGAHDDLTIAVAMVSWYSHMQSQVQLGLKPGPRVEIPKPRNPFSSEIRPDTSGKIVGSDHTGESWRSRNPLL